MHSDQMKMVIAQEIKFEWIMPNKEEWLGENRLYPPREDIGTSSETKN